MQQVFLADNIVVENVGHDLLVFLPGSSDILRLSGEPADLLRSVVDGKIPNSVDSGVVHRLIELGVLRSPAISRRHFVGASALGLGAGLSLMALPHTAAAASSTAQAPSTDPSPTPRSTGLPGDTVPAVTPEDALVLYVDAMNPTSYPGTGSTWFDIGGNNNDVFFPASANQHPTYFEDSDSGLSWFVFDGNDYFDIIDEASKKIANVSPYSGFTGYSVEAWVWDNTGTSGSRNIVSGGDKFLFLNGDSLQAGGQGQYGDLVSPSFPKNQWVYVAFTYDTASKRATLYVDGVQKAQKTSTVNYVVYERVTVGAHNLTTPTSFWVGRIAEVRIFARELSSAEISSNYNATKGRYPLPVV
jgi:hypothetical protein